MYGQTPFLQSHKPSYYACCRANCLRRWLRNLRMTWEYTTNNLFQNKNDFSLSSEGSTNSFHITFLTGKSLHPGHTQVTLNSGRCLDSDQTTLKLLVSNLVYSNWRVYLTIPSLQELAGMTYPNPFGKRAHKSGQFFCASYFTIPSLYCDKR